MIEKKLNERGVVLESPRVLKSLSLLEDRRHWRKSDGQQGSSRVGSY